MGNSLSGITPLWIRAGLEVRQTVPYPSLAGWGPWETWILASLPQTGRQLNWEEASIPGTQWAPSVRHKAEKPPQIPLFWGSSSIRSCRRGKPPKSDVHKSFQTIERAAGGDLGAGKGISCLRRILTLEHPAVAATFSRWLNPILCSYFKKRKKVTANFKLFSIWKPMRQLIT